MLFMASPMMMKTTLITLQEFSLVWSDWYWDGRGFHLSLLHGKFLGSLAFFLGLALPFPVLCFLALRACDCYRLMISGIDTTMGIFNPLVSIASVDSVTVCKDSCHGSHDDSCNCSLESSGVHRKGRGFVVRLTVSGR